MSRMNLKPALVSVFASLVVGCGKTENTSVKPDAIASVQSAPEKDLVDLRAPKIRTEAEYKPIIKDLVADAAKLIDQQPIPDPKSNPATLPNEPVAADLNARLLQELKTPGTQFFKPKPAPTPKVDPPPVNKNNTTVDDYKFQVPRSEAVSALIGARQRNLEESLKAGRLTPEAKEGLMKIVEDNQHTRQGDGSFEREVTQGKPFALKFLGELKRYNLGQGNINDFAKAFAEYRAAREKSGEPPIKIPQ